MSILSGYKKVKNYIETGSGKKLLSRWTSSNTVEFNDGKTAQTKVGAIKGITTSTSATETGYAADATTVAALNQSLAAQNNYIETLFNSPASNISANTSERYLTINFDMSKYKMIMVVFGIAASAPDAVKSSNRLIGISTYSDVSGKNSSNNNYRSSLTNYGASNTFARVTYRLTSNTIWYTCTGAYWTYACIQKIYGIK